MHLLRGGWTQKSWELDAEGRVREQVEVVGGSEGVSVVNRLGRGHERPNVTCCILLNGLSHLLNLHIFSSEGFVFLSCIFCLLQTISRTPETYQSIRNRTVFEIQVIRFFSGFYVPNSFYSSLRLISLSTFVTEDNYSSRGSLLPLLRKRTQELIQRL